MTATYFQPTNSKKKKKEKRLKAWGEADSREKTD